VIRSERGGIAPLIPSQGNSLTSLAYETLDHERRSRCSCCFSKNGDNALGEITHLDKSTQKCACRNSEMSVRWCFVVQGTVYLITFQRLPHTHSHTSHTDTQDTQTHQSYFYRHTSTQRHTHRHTDTRGVMGCSSLIREETITSRTHIHREPE
jgi:hypothetical protein